MCVCVLLYEYVYRMEIFRKKTHKIRFRLDILINLSIDKLK